METKQITNGTIFLNYFDRKMKVIDWENNGNRKFKCVYVDTYINDRCGMQLRNKVSLLNGNYKIISTPK